MVTKKEIITLDRKIFGRNVLEDYARIDAEIKNLEAEKEVLKALIHKGLEKSFDPVKSFKCGNFSFIARELWDCDQQATYAAMEKAATRKILYPSAVLFKPGKDKELAKKHGLLTMTYSNPVIKVG
jgi:hypothetical protein